MKNVVVLAVCAGAVALAALFALPDSASSADPTAAKIAALQKQVKVLQASIKKLQRDQQVTDDQLALNFEGDTCLGAQTADLVQGTWSVIDQVATALQQKTYFGAQTPTDDYKNCADLAQPNVPRPGIVVPPTIEPLRVLLQWLHIEI